MALFDTKTKDVTIKENVYETSKPQHRSNVVDTQFINRTSLLKHVEGSPWKVNYYSQVLGRDDTTEGLQETRGANRQQYVEIRDLVLKVISPLSADQDTETKNMRLSGTAYVTHKLIPNKGDHFTADIGDGREGIIEVTESRRLSHLEDTVHEINYILRDYLTDNYELQNDWKVVKVMYAFQDPLRYSNEAIIEAGLFSNLKRLNKYYRDTLDEYLDRYWSNEFHTLLVPGDVRTTYDHFMTVFVNKLYSINETSLYRDIKILNVKGDYNVLTCNTVLDAIIKREKRILNTSIKEIGVAYTRDFNKHPFFGSVGYTGIQSIIYPIDGVSKFDYQYNIKKRITKRPFTSPNDHFKEIDLNVTYKDVLIKDLSTIEQPLIKPILIDNFYIFSKDFYEGGRLSVLEDLVKNFLDNQNPDIERLDLIIKQRDHWLPLEDFYYTPILLLLIYAFSRLP